MTGEKGKCQQGDKKIEGILDVPYKGVSKKCLGLRPLAKNARVPRIVIPTVFFYPQICIWGLRSCRMPIKASMIAVTGFT